MFADNFNPEELLLLSNRIDELLKAMDNREYAYCEDDEAYEDCCNCAEQAAVKLRHKPTNKLAQPSLSPKRRKRALLWVEPKYF